MADSKDTHASDALKIRSLEFMGGMSGRGTGDESDETDAQPWRPESDLPEIAFAGRSNVGKSSLLNTLLRRRDFVRVSRTPGRTREINFFKVNGEIVFVDLPGYGYAKISKQQKAEWRPLIERYLKWTTQLRGIVLLLDARREPTDDDIAMLDFLADLEIPTLIAITKIDKLSKKEAIERVKDIAISLQLEEDQIIRFSAHTGEGRNELAEALQQLLA